MAFSNDEIPMGRRTPEHVAARLEELILEGVFRPGQLLPSERRLCDRLGVSRASLREGLRILRSKAIIDTRQGHGSTVASLLPVDPQSPLMHLFRDHPRTLFDLLEVRSLLEGESAYLAAKRGTSMDRVLITRRYQEMADYAAQPEALDVERLARLDHAFHLAISQASHNPVLVHTLQSLTDLLLSSVFASMKHLYHRPGPREMINQQHVQLHDAVVSGDAEQAKRIALEHLTSISELLRELEAEHHRLERSAMRLEQWQ
ncbi:transcriptional regulator GlcC [Halomonas sp. HL-93]|uniref:transcriptional regulator GlcC n=1 Tax=Halomonas sp. HL-93 TaxID=1666906 RepID=UPI00047F3FAA|nr:MULTISPECIES: transcriptional regulator GlcC [unclassified Halomonas]KPQ26310.1 MAG: GntR family transcriptional regulator, transcriptional repressor for pyruvate dehydrogenase complex [Halomonas sp. HL-48]SBR46464.1 transcriptional regulator, GntR family [Halomonas sp. HL-93]